MNLDDLAHIPRMINEPTGRYCYQMGRRWSGPGLAVELGCWLGYSCACMAKGLVAAGYDREIHCYDHWRASREEVRHAKQRAGLKLKRKQDLTPVFLEFVTPVYERLVPHRCRVADARWDGEPIELFVLDAAKRNPDFATVLRAFGPSWIPGVTSVLLLDLYHYRQSEHTPERRELFRVQKRFLERYADCFEPIPSEPEVDHGDWWEDLGFLYTQPIDFATAVIE